MSTNIFDDTLESLDDEQTPAGNPFDDTLRLDETAGRQRLRGAMVQAAETTPDRAAETRRLGARFGVAPDAVERDFDTYAKRGTVEAVPIAQIQAEAPQLAAWLEKPDNAKIASDDIEPLQLLAKTLKVGTNALRSMAAGPLAQFNVGAWGTAQLAAEWLGADSLAGWFKRARESAGLDAAFARGTQDGAGAIEKAFYSGFESLGGMAPGLLMGGLAGTATPMLSTMGVQTGGAAFGQARDQGTGLLQSTVFAAQQSAVEVLTEAIPAKWFLADLAKNAPFLKILGHQLAGEVPGEQVATLLQDFNEWAVLHPEDPFQKYLDERPSAAAQTLIATITAVGVQTSLGKVAASLAGDGGRAKQSEQDQAFLKDLTAAVKGSKTVERSPADAAALIETLAEGKKGYVPADTFATFFQDQTLETAHGPVTGAEAIADELTGRSGALKEAIRSGVDLELPASVYALQLVGPHAAYFTEEIRVDSPDRMNAREFKAFSEAEVAKADAPVTEEVAAPNPVRQEIIQKIQAAVAGTKVKLPAGAVEGYADIFEALTTTFEREGLDPVATLQKYGLLVVGPQEGGSSNLTPPAKRPFKEVVAEMKAKRDAWVADVSAVFSAEGGVKLTGKNGVTHLIHPSTREPGLIQVTSFTGDGTPSGHFNAKTIEEAARELQGETITKTKTRPLGDVVAAVQAKSAARTAPPAAPQPAGAPIVPVDEDTAEAAREAASAASKTPEGRAALSAQVAADDAARDARMGEDASRRPAYTDPDAVRAGRAMMARLSKARVDKAEAVGQTEDADAASGPEPSRLADRQRSAAGDRVQASHPGTGAQAAERADAHLGRVFDATLAAAQSIEPGVDPALIRGEFEYRLELFLDRQSLAAESGHNPHDILRAIAKLGGIAVTEDTAGELRDLQGPFGTVIGIPRIKGVFRTKQRGTSANKKTAGHGLDVILQDLHSGYPEFRVIESIDMLRDQIDEAARHQASDPTAGRLPGTEELRDVGIKAETTWWHDLWMPLPESADESANTPPREDAAFLSRSDYNATLRSTYFDADGTMQASSRETPQTAAIPPVGSWMIDNTQKMLDGREIEQLVELPVGNIEISEDTGRGKFADVERFARWMLEGKEAPPIRVVQTDRGTLKTLDHRRLLAAKAAGRDSIKAWVSWAAPSTREGAPIVGLTKELADAGATPIPIADARAEHTIFKDDARLLKELSDRLIDESATEGDTSFDVSTLDQVSELFQDAPDEPTAVYVGEQDDGQGGSVSLFTVTGGPRHQSTVTEPTLVALGIPVPAKELEPALPGMEAIGGRAAELGDVPFRLTAQIAATPSAKRMQRTLFQDPIDAAESAGVSQEEIAALLQLRAEGVEPRILTKAQLQAAGFDLTTVLYHQTATANVEAIKAEGFDLTKGRARLSDEQVPDGVFFKPTTQDIGVGGQPGEVSQVPVYLRMGEVRTFTNRADLEATLSADEQYRTLVSDARAYDKEQAREFDRRWEQIRARDVRGETYAAVKLEADIDNFLAEWKEGNNALAALARARATEVFKAEGVETVVIQEDRGSFKRTTRTVIAIGGNQVALAEPGNERILFQPFFHGSPHEFDRFSAEKIGTGEGAQTFGWGLYFAENPKVAKEYQKRLPDASSPYRFTVDGKRLDDNTPERHAASLLFFGELREVRRTTKRWIQEAAEPDALGMTDTAKQAGLASEEYWRRLDAFAQTHTKRDIKGAQGLLYQVDIPDAAIEKMLDHDAPIAKQPKPVQEMARARLKELKYLTPTDDGPRVLARAMDAYATEHGGFSEKINGGMIYDMLVKAEKEKGLAADAEQRVSLALNAAGVPGLKYFDEGSRGNGRGTRNVVVFDDSIVTLTHKDGTAITAAERQEFFQVDPPTPPPVAAPGKRGSISLPPGSEWSDNPFFGPDLQFTLKMFEGADATTFTHESAHFFLKIMQDLAARPEASARIKGDLKLLQEWFFGPGGQGTIGRAEHERFANAFNVYLHEGKAPSLALRPIFAKFRTWFMRFTAELIRYDVKLTDDVRGVFDRMLATDAAIAEAQAAVVATPMFTTPESARMSAEEFEVYQAKIAEAGQTARETLEGKLLRDLQRQQRADYRDEKQAIRETVEAEVYAMPVYQALAAMRKGTHPDGTPLVEGVPLEPLKLSRQVIVDRYGPERLAALPKSVPPIYAADGGMDPDTVAELFGFASGDALLTAAAEALPMRGLVEAETTKRMTAQAGDLIVDDKLSDLAKAAVANEHREAIVRIEMQTLARLRRTAQAGAVKERDYERRWFEAEAKLRIAIAEGHKQVEIDALQTEVTTLKSQARGGAARINAGLPTDAELREVARARIGRTRIRDLKPALFYTAARQAGQKAFEAAARQDFDSAIAAKQQEAISLALYREASRVVEDVEARVRAAQALDTPASRKRIGLAGASYQEQIDGILDRYEFARITGKALTKREALRQWISQLEADGFSVDLPEDAIDDARRINYRELPVDELVAVSDTLKSIVHLARLKNRLLKNKDARDFAIERDKLIASIREHNTGKPVPLEFRPADDRRRSIGEWFASHARIGTLAQVMDGPGDGGAMWSAIVRPINEATDAKQARNGTEGTAYAAIMAKHYPGRELGRWHEQKDVAGVGSLSKEARLAVALNWGNQTSRDRLLNDPRRKWNAKQIDAILDTLDARDWAYVVETWRFLDRFWPEIAAKTERLTGIAPERVEGIPVVTKFGTFEGGYYPLAYDARMNIKSQQHEAATEAKLKTSAAYVRTTTRRGHLEARQSHVKLSVRLDLGVMFSHLEQVIHDLTHHETLIDVTRLLRDPAVSNAILETKGDLVYQQFTRALESIAAGELDSAKTGAEEWATFMRTGTQIALLGYNLWTGIQQPLGLFNGAQRVGVRWVARGLGRWLADTATLTSATAWIDSVSPFMATRSSAATQDLADLRSTMRTAGGWFDTLVRTVTLDTVTQQHILDSFLWHIGVMQRVADVPTWLGQFEKSMAAGETEARAIALADQSVIDSQGSGRLSDLSQVQRGGPVARLFMTFYSYGSATYNATYRAAGQTNFKKPAEVTKFLAAVSLIYVFPAMATVALREMVGKGSGDDDEDEWARYMSDVGRETLASALNSMVWVRELAQIAAEGTRGYAGPAGARALQMLYQLAGQVKQGEADDALLKALNTVGGVFLRYPAAQLQRTVDGWRALEADETDNPAALLFGPPRD